MLCVRQAGPDDRPFIDEIYRSIDFLPSSDADFLAVAELGDARVGVGRLVPLGRSISGSRAVELGGIFVAEEHRGRGVARALIEFLLARAAGSRVYCIPFKNLAPLYRAYGLADCWEDTALPSKILEKLDHLRRHVARPVVLLVKEP